MNTAQKRLQMILEMRESQPADSFLNYALALEYLALDEKQKAEEIFKNLVQNNPDYLPTYYQLGKLLEEKQQLTEAIQIYLSGKKLARSLGELKTLGELNEALMLLDVYED